MRLLFVAASIILSVATTAAAVDRELVAVSVLFRHGDRNPIRPYRNDPYKDPSNWPGGLAQLTSKGKRMQYNLGRYLRQRYGGGRVLGQEYRPKEIFVRSTDNDRTLMSAESNLAGLYPPAGDQVWNPDLAWQPIPVHTVPIKDDVLFVHAECPRYSKLYREACMSKQVQEINQEYEWLFDFVTNHTGDKIDSLHKLGFVFDTLYIERLYNKTLPSWSEEVFPHPMEKLSNFGFALNSLTLEMQRLRSGPMVKFLVDRMTNMSQSARTNTTSRLPGMVMLSAHDTTIANLLNSFGQFDPPIKPPYASCVMIELFHNKDSNDCEVRALFRNQSDREPFLLDVHGCGEFCAMSAFVDLTRPVYTDDWASECQLPDQQDPFAVAVTYVALAFTGALFLCLMVAVAIRCCRRGKASFDGDGEAIAKQFGYVPVIHDRESSIN